ncbi:MAG: response regulator [Flavobacterium sp.]
MYSKPVKIAVIDNDKIYQIITSKLISKIDENIKVLEFLDGIYAYESLSEQLGESWPDLLLLDIEMPIMDGWEFLESFLILQKKSNKSIPIYMVSSSIAPDDRIKANSYSEVNGYLEKPLNLEVIQKILEEQELL